MFDLLTPTSKLGVVAHIRNPSIEEAKKLIPRALCLASGEFKIKYRATLENISW